MDLKDFIEKNLLDYVSTMTHTGCDLENNNIDFFNDWFDRVDYFRNNPDLCGFHNIQGDQLGRKVPWALLKGDGDETIVLIHHTDTVDTMDYGKHQNLAYKPYDLTKRYVVDNVEMDQQSKKDLDSGKWIFGRGVADMKGGAAIHLALMEQYSKNKDFKGNLLLLGLPDEENLSAGMRGAITLMKNLKTAYGLNYRLLLNVEPHERKDEKVATIYDGSVGKIMPIFYVRGKLAHVGQVFRGFNPINLLSEIVRRTELSTDFIEKVGNTTTPPPTWLYLKDRKQVYDVSLPTEACGYMSILTLDKPPSEIFSKLEEVSRDSFEKVIEDMNKSFKVYMKSVEEEYSDLGWTPKVKRYGEVYREAIADSGPAFTEALEKLMSEIRTEIEKNEISIAEGSYRIIEMTLEYVNDLSPIVVIGLAPPYYPNVHNSMIPEKADEMIHLTNEIVCYAMNEWNQEYVVQTYYTGISDLSYGMFRSKNEDIQYIEENMLMWDDIYYIPLEIIKEISMPVMNIGPWGKDFHKYTERVYKEDLFHRTPELVNKVVESILGN